MSDPTSFASRLELLHVGGHPLGLDHVKAAKLNDALRAGDGVERALEKVGKTGALTRALAIAKPGDALAVSERLLVPMADSMSAARAITTALATPMVVLTAVLLAAGVMRFVSFSALEQLAFDVGTHTDATSLTVTIAGATALMGLLILLAFFDVPLPMFSAIRRGPQRALVLEAAAALADAQVPLQLAFAGAAAFADDAALHQATQSVAQALAAGQPIRNSLVLSDTASKLLSSAASQGVGGPVLWALARHARLAAARDLAWHLQMIQVATLGLAAMAVLGLGVSWLSTYSQLLTHGG